MPLLDSEGRSVADPWLAVGDDDPLPEGRPVIVPLARWRAEHAALSGRNGPVGVRVPNTEIVASLGADVHRLGVIALEFPKFTDGRAYSQARLLRRRLGFKGELRATGHVLRDQLFFMRRCGFDSFEARDDRAVTGFAEAMSEIGVVYQPAADDRVPALAARALSARAAE